MELPVAATSGDGTLASNDTEKEIQELDNVDMECTICMEFISEQTVLPCQCKLHYCQSCWDKALANSFGQCGQARCPSCRAFVRVDFDNEKHCLMFTPESCDMTFAAQNELIDRIRQEYRRSLQESQMPPSQESFHQFLEAHEVYPLLESMEQQRQSTVDRLRHQAMPAQIKILQRYFEANPSLVDIQSTAKETLATVSVAELKSFMSIANVDADGCLEKSELVSRLVEQSDIASLCCLWASQKCAAPKCVCGSFLMRISGFERFKNSLRERATVLPDEDIQRQIQMLESRGTTIVICDICEKNIPLGSGLFLWTCENRYSTILHATSYDICDKCFVDAASRV